MRRRDHEAIRDTLTERIGHLETQVRRGEERYDELLTKYHALAAPKAPQTLPVAKQDPVMDVINEMAGFDHRLRAIMAKQVMIDRANNLSDSDIIQRIRAGTVADVFHIT